MYMYSIFIDAPFFNCHINFMEHKYCKFLAKLYTMLYYLLCLVFYSSFCYKCLGYLSWSYI